MSFFFLTNIELDFLKNSYFEKISVVDVLILPLTLKTFQKTSSNNRVWWVARWIEVSIHAMNKNSLGFMTYDEL